MFPEMRPRVPLAGAAIAACGGVVAADCWQLVWWGWVIAFLITAGLVLWQRKVWLCWITVALAFASLHTLRHFGSVARDLSTHLSEPRVVRAIGVIVTEPEKPKGFSRTTTARFRLRLEELELASGVHRIDAVVQVRWAGEMPVYGDRIELKGSATNLQPARNPGQFDFRKYAERQGVYSEISARYASDCRILGHGYGNPAQAAAFRSRTWIRDQLALDLTDDPATADLIASMVLGLRGETPEEIQELFRLTGTLHLFAVSGLNIGMLGWISWFFLKPLRISRRISIYLIIPLLVFYAMITGLSPSCVRATIMGSLLLAGILFDRRVSIFNSLGAAALLVLMWDTNQFFMAGAQFSFALVAALAWLAKPLEKQLDPFGKPDSFVPRAIWNLRQRLVYFGWRWVAALIAVTVAAWCGSSPFTAAYFHMFSLGSIVANLLAVPLAGAILALGLLATIASPISTALTVLFNNANWFCVKLLVGSVHFFAHVPYAHTYIEVRAPASHAAEYTVFDLDDGGSVHIRQGTEDWLVDCGHRFEYERIVLPYLRSRGVDQIDALVLTHGDAQHIGAAQDVWSELQPQAVFDLALKDRSQTRRNLHKAMIARGFGKRFAARGDVLELEGGVRLEVLYPPRGLQRSLADDKALVLRLTTGGFRTLFVSDAGFFTEQWLIENEPDLGADVLVKGWHSKDASDAFAFLDQVKPRVVIVGSMGFGGKASVLEEYVGVAAEQGAAVFRQDQAGAVRVDMSREGSLRVRGYLNGQETVLQSQLPPRK